jgi:protein-tyrosine-phosphatase
VRVESAGFIGPGRSCPPEAVTAAALRGVDLSAHRSALLMADLARSADLILVMDELQGCAIRERFGRAPSDIVVLGDLDPATTATRGILDPVEQDLAVFVESYARIERCVAALGAALALPRRSSVATVERCP